MPRALKRSNTSDVERIQKIAAKDAVDDIGTEKFTCGCCGRLLRRNQFYKSSDPVMRTGVTCICKDCAYDIAHPKDKDGNPQDATIDTIRDVLQRLDKPFLYNVFEASEKESKTRGDKTMDVYACYMKNIAMPQYRFKRWKDGDFDAKTGKTQPKRAEIKAQDEEIEKSTEQNRKDVIKLLGFDPFSEDAEKDKPFLYANLVSYLDASEEANQDAMRNSSIVEIVRGFSVIQKYGEYTASMYSNPDSITKNASTLKTIEDTKAKIITNITKLAEESCVSMKNSKTNTKGENTLTGKFRKLRDMDLREAEVNLFDAETASGLKQVADISNKSILDQINLDENDEHGMLLEQRELIKKYKEIADRNEETARILLRENADLKETLEEHGISINSES